MSKSESRKKRNVAIVIGIVFLLAIAGAGGMMFQSWWSNRPIPYGIPERVAWTASRVIGAPEPPDPYLTQRVFPKLKFAEPLDIEFPPESKRVFVVQHDGKIFSFPNDNAVAKADLAIDISKLPALDKAHFPKVEGSETLGLVFDPKFQQNHYCYVCYHANFPGKQAIDYAAAYPQNKTASHVSRFTVSADDPPTIDPASEQILITWPGNGHNAGCLRFGPDGDLYISTGDNGDPDPPDPFQIAQDVGDLRSKILRIDVSHPSGNLPYTIPADNPFVSAPAGARGEVYAYGLRNPWRMNFDRETGDLFAGDVGWELWESVFHIKSGGNYGWSITEGPQPVYPNGKRGPTEISRAEFSLPHSEAASVTGGTVYRGKQLSGLRGQYVFGDWQTRRLWAAPFDGKNLAKYHLIAQTDLKVVAFGEDADGELYIVDHGLGGIWRLAPNPNAGTDSIFPRKLSETGLFSNTANQVPNPGVLPFDVIAPQWVDGASADRFIAVPSKAPVIDNKDNERIYPDNTVLVRTFSLPVDGGTKKIDTQLLHYDGRQWHGYSYQWNDAQTDATLVEAQGADVPITVVDSSAPGGKRQQIWHFNSRAQCMTCHTNWTNYTLAFNEMQLDRKEQYQSPDHGLVSDNQIRSFRKIGLLPPGKPDEPPLVGDDHAKSRSNLVNPYDEDETISLEDRARSYLEVNCSVCHRLGGGGTALIDVRRTKSLRDSKLVSNPMLGAFNLTDAQIVCPGDPSRSVMYYRMAKTGAGHMPHIGSNVIDDRGLALMERWIASLPAGDASAREPRTADEAKKQDAALASLISTPTGDSAKFAIRDLLETTDGALKLVAALSDGRLGPGLRTLSTQMAITSPKDTVRDLFARFSNQPLASGPKVGTTPDVEKLLAMTGDAERGRKVFFETAGGLCSKCHIVDKQGTDFGPDLSKIAAKFTRRADMLDNILNPSKTILKGYETWTVETKAKDVYIGFIISKSDAEVLIKSQDQKLTRVKSGDIERMRQQPISAMPEGVISDLELQQAADLLAFLEARK